MAREVDGGNYETASRPDRATENRGHKLDGVVSVPNLPVPTGPAPGAPSAPPPSEPPAVSSE